MAAGAHATSNTLIPGSGADGTFRYNGFDFNRASVKTSAVQVRPVISRDGRSVIRNEWSISVRMWIPGPRTNSPAYESTIAKLTHSGGELTFNGRLGNVRVGGGGKKDLAWGPVPELLTIQTDNGLNNLIEWKVRFSIPHCSGAPTAGAIMDLSTECSFDLDQSGYTTRTYTATLTIPMSRRAVGDATLPDSADLYLERVVPLPLPGFRRIPPSRQLSADKCTLTVTVRDEEMPPNIPPAGVIEAKASHTVSTEGAGVYKWVGTIRASYELARGVGTFATAAKAFRALCRDRIDASVAELKKKGVKGAFAHKVRYSFEEPDLYGKPTAAFTLVYTFSGVLPDIMLQACSLFRPVPGSSWTQWIASIASSVGDRGNANLVFRPGDDRIVTLCDRQDFDVSLAGNGRPPQTGRLDNEGEAELRAEFSWYDYKNGLRWETDQGTAELRTLPKDNSPLAKPNGGTKPTGGAVIPYGGGSNLGPFGIIAETFGAVPRPGVIVIPPNGAKANALLTGGGKLDNLPASTGTAMSNLFDGAVGRLDNNRDGEVKAQTRVRPLVYLLMEGHAVRVGFPIPEPILESVNGVKVRLANRLDRGEGFACKVVANWGRPVYAAQWRFRYAVPEYIPGPLPVLPNPIEGG